MKKKIIVFILLIVSLLGVNQIYYLNTLQFKCTEKIESGLDLNLYEKFSALQTHANLGLFGWIVEPNVARMCLIKQFHINPNSLTGNIMACVKLPEDDDVIKQAKQKLISKECNKVRLAWKYYNSKASILYNGSTLSIYNSECGPVFWYDIYVDYKPGIIKINNITLSETVFDYLENKNILSVYKTEKVQKFTDQEIKQYNI